MVFASYEVATAIMRLATIGPWQFEMPDGWALVEDDNSDNYFDDA